ncbi:MAG: hypothetical protein IPP53_16715 [Bacteroidetes bacterium]|nr:hypothetical protein [Bacteroidota bacterium]
MDIEVFIDEPASNESLSIECYSKENANYFKYFVLPANITMSKLIFYIAPDQELRCEIVGPNFEKDALDCFKKSNNKLIKIK